MVCEDTAVLLLSHGSSLSYGKKVFTEICQKFKDKTDFDAEVGYMKASEPTLAQAINLLNQRNPNLKRIIAVPVFLAPGIHTNIDIPILLGKEPKEIDPRYPDGNYPDDHYLSNHEDIEFNGQIILLDAIGPNPYLVEFINKRISSAIEDSKLDNAKTGVLLISHGSRLKYNKEFLSDLFNQFQSQYDGPSGFGFMELEKPDIPTAINTLYDSNDFDRLIVIPIFIAQGIHTQIDIKAILGLIDNKSKQKAKSKSKNQTKIQIGSKIVEKDDHEHRLNNTEIKFKGEILYSEPIGSDDVLIKIIESMVLNALNID